MQGCIFEIGSFQVSIAEIKSVVRDPFKIRSR